MYYVYVHEFTNGTRYIGKGKGKRAYNFKYRNKYWNNLSNKYGLPSVTIIADGISESDAFDLEMFLIHELKSSGYILCNLTEGGEGCSGRVLNEDTKRKIGEANKGNTPSNKGNPRSDGTKRKIGEANKGSKNGMFGRYGSKNPSYGSGYTYEITSPNGITYIIGAGFHNWCKQLGLIPSNLLKVARGERSHHKGYTAKIVKV